MAKRKREAPEEATTGRSKALRASRTDSSKHASNGTVSKAISGMEAGHEETTKVQIVAGSYDRVLHGIIATIPQSSFSASDDTFTIDFADSFLFNAHTSAIRCLAISPPTAGADSKSQKVILASGSTDQRINLYTLSTAPPSLGKKPNLPNLTGIKVSENPKNRELGSLMHHTSSISSLQFPTRSKLLSAAEDNTIAISRTRDWTVLSTLKAPIPKAIGRPSGDTAAPGEVPAGVNDFAIHPSMKFMVSVGKGERCMRLWNLLTGKKAGVLNFEKEMLQQAGEGKYGSGEGRKVVWAGGDDPQEFVIGFERSAVVYGMDSKPIAYVSPVPRTKLHQIAYLPDEFASRIIVSSTEDGRILFHGPPPNLTEANDDNSSLKEPMNSTEISACSFLGQLGGALAGITGRIKDFDIISLPRQSKSSPEGLLFITANSDGTIRVWLVKRDEIQEPSLKIPSKQSTNSDSQESPRQLGRILGVYETGNRITCLKSFIMSGEPDDTEPDATDGIPLDGLGDSESSDE